jgi:hypothetical protein
MTHPPLSAKFATLRCHLATIPDPLYRETAWRLLAEIEQRVRAVAIRLEGDDLRRIAEAVHGQDVLGELGEG